MKLNLIIFVILSSLVLISCGKSKNKKNNVGKAGENIGLKLGDQKNFTSAEMTTAAEICRAFLAKRGLFRRSFSGRRFDFKFTHSTCAGKTEEATINTTLDVGRISSPVRFYYSGTQKFYQEMESDQFGELKDLCPSFLRNEVKSNTVANGNSKTLYRFSRDDDKGIAFLAISIGKKRDSSSSNDNQFYTVVEEKVFEIALKNLSRPSVLKGRVAQRGHSIQCSDDPKKKEVITQKALN